MTDTSTIIRLCRERAAQYGAVRGSSLTAIALDRAADALEDALGVRRPSAQAGAASTLSNPSSFGKPTFGLDPAVLPTDAGPDKVEPLTDDIAMDAAAESIGGSTVYGAAEAWSEGKTLTILFHRTGQLAKFRFVKLHDGPTAGDLRGEPA